jgi:hypothetical protein
MKHLERCSYTIPENLFKNKWGVVAKAWANNPIQNQNGFKLIIQIVGRTRSEGGGCSWCKATIMSSKGIVGVMGWRDLVA